jgi:quercetin dioxygenase-like cupin family protein
VSEPATHHVTRAADIAPIVPENYAAVSSGYTRAQIVGRHIGAVHTGTALSFLAANGHIEPHVHSLEESFYVLEGTPTLTLDGDDYLLAPNECGLIPVGVEHAWRGAADAPTRWLEIQAPAPRISGDPDTFFTRTPLSTGTGEPVDIRDPRSRTFFRLTPDQMDLDTLKAGAPVDAPTVSASMATAVLAYSGIALKMLVDQRLGAVLHTTFMVDYQHGGVAQPHDHPLEESYFIVDGEVEATADGETIVLRAGDVFWTGVGCVHSFLSRDPTTRVRWIESQSPQPPSHHSYRFNRDWDYLKTRLSTEPADA